MRPRKHNLTKEQLQQYQSMGWGMVRIAAAEGCHHATVRLALRAHGLPTVNPLTIEGGWCQTDWDRLPAAIGAVA